MHGGSDKMYEIGSEFHERTTQIGINKYTNLIFRRNYDKFRRKNNNRIKRISKRI